MLRDFKFDANLSGIQETDEGFLRIPSRFSRVGIQQYSDGNGGLINEYRPAEEVFNDDSMKTFIGKPVTFMHPTEEVTPENIKKYQVGSIISFKKEDGTFTNGEIIITDANAIEYILKRRKNNKDVQMSCGYKAMLEHQDGEFEGQKFDAIQRNIRGNHVAIVPRGRAGEEVKMKLDSLNKGERRMKLKLDSIMGLEAMIIDSDDIESVVAQIKQRERAILDASEKLNEEIASLKKDSEENQAKLDSVVAEKEELEKKVEEMVTKEDMEEIIKNRGILNDAAKLAEIKIDEMVEGEAKKAIIKSVFDCDLDEKSEDYINARFDSAIEMLKKDAEEKALKKANGVVDGEKKADEAPKSRQDVYNELFNKLEK